MKTKNLLLLISLFVGTIPCNNFSQNKEISLNDITGHVMPSKNKDFIDLEKLDLPTRKKEFLRKEVAFSLKKAYLSFKQTYPDIPFVILSSTRTYEHQTNIWNRKWNRLKSSLSSTQKALNILRYSSMPGTSRHHWGTEVDISSLDNSYFEKNAQGKILYSWLQKHMAEFGFCQTYTKGRSSGYQEEKWHWSYLPLSTQFLKTYENFLENNKKELLSKLVFKGSSEIALEQYVRTYVFSINPACLIQTKNPA